MKFLAAFYHSSPSVEGMILAPAMHITAGKLDLGLWQQVYHAEFDGRHPKRVIIKVMGE